MANVIEKSLMKTPGVSVCSAPPTISSILKTDHRDLAFVKRSGSDSLATLSVRLVSNYFLLALSGLMPGCQVYQLFDTFFSDC